MRMRLVFPIGFLMLFATAFAQGPIQAVVSVVPQKCFVERIGGPYVHVESIIPPGQSEHSFELTPKQMAGLSKTQIYFTIDVPFERVLESRLRPICPKMRCVDTTVGIEKIMMESHDHGDASEHHEGEEPDPHVWLSPDLIEKQARIIADTLSEIDSAHASEYKNNCETFKKELQVADKELHALLDPYRGRTFYVFHPAYGYFAQTYGLKQKAIELGGKTPAPQQMAELIRQAKNDGVRTIFVQAEFDRGSAQRVAEAIGATTVTLNPLSPDVIGNLKTMGAKLAQSFRDASITDSQKGSAR
jgi:zinc transport system substrate-binding protein